MKCDKCDLDMDENPTYIIRCREPGGCEVVYFFDKPCYDIIKSLIFKETTKHDL